MRHLSKVFWILVILFLFHPKYGDSAEIQNTFHKLIHAKTELETKFGVEELECYPFIANIGFTEDQIPLIENCYQTVSTLKQVLTETNLNYLRVVGISHRFLKSGGFDTVLLKAGATKEEIIQFLGAPLSREGQQRFLDQISQVKARVRDKIRINELYCTMKISNEDCLNGYQTLAAVLENTLLKNKTWQEIVVTDSFDLLKNPDALAIKFDGSQEEIRDALVFKDPQAQWAEKEAIYEKLEEPYGEWLRTNLNLIKLFCGLNLTEQECLQGAANLYIAGPRLTDKHWNQVTFDKFNTLIEDDFDTTIRYDLKPDEIVSHLAAKPTKEETLKNVNLSEKLEGKTKNNASGLRVICDLIGLRSALCVQGFEHFIQFMKANRQFKAISSKTELMFVDGNKLARVNFALNSKTRKSYIYADANSEFTEFKNYLLKFGEVEAAVGR